MVGTTVLNMLAGHDPLDATTVPDKFVPFDLADDISQGRLRSFRINSDRHILTVRT